LTTGGLRLQGKETSKGGKVGESSAVTQGLQGGTPVRKKEIDTPSLDLPKKFATEGIKKRFYRGKKRRKGKIRKKGRGAPVTKAAHGEKSS